MHDLMDFTPRDNFNFFKFRYEPEKEKKEIFLSKCERVLEYAHATVQDLCLLGYNLLELKNGGTWKEVRDPESGNTFNYLSFEKFCAHAFGFSETKTSNLLSLSQFVQISGGRHGSFIEERYANFNTSQLIELAPVGSGQRHYFTADMTVREMRIVKDYLNKGNYWEDKLNEDFDVLTYARRFKEAKDTLKGISSFLSDTTSKPLPGQLTFTDVVQEDSAEKDEEVEAEISDVGTDEAEAPIEELETQIEDISDVGYPNEETFEEEVEAEQPSSDVGTCSAQESDSADDQAEVSKYRFDNRKNIRAFYADYKNWDKIYELYPWAKVYRYKFKNGMAILAMETTTCKDLKGMVADVDNVRYFWRAADEAGECRTYEVSLLYVEQYVPTIKDEL